MQKPYKVKVTKKADSLSLRSFPLFASPRLLSRVSRAHPDILVTLRSGTAEEMACSEAGNLLADLDSVLVCGAIVYPAVDARVDDLVVDLGESRVLVHRVCET